MNSRSVYWGVHFSSKIVSLIVPHGRCSAVLHAALHGFQFDLFDASRSFANVDIGAKPGSRLVRLRDTAAELIRLRCAHQIDGTAAKSTAHHAGTKHAGLLHGELDHEIEFTATDFIVVAKTVVRLTHQMAQ